MCESSWQANKNYLEWRNIHTISHIHPTFQQTWHMILKFLSTIPKQCLIIDILILWSVMSENFSTPRHIISQQTTKIISVHKILLPAQCYWLYLFSQLHSRLSNRIYLGSNTLLKHVSLKRMKRNVCWEVSSLAQYVVFDGWGLVKELTGNTWNIKYEI